MEVFLKDLRLGLRLLARSPLFTVIVTATLALGIGANTAIFSVVNAILLVPLPFRDSERLVVLAETSQQLPRISPSYPNFLDWRRQCRSFEQMAALVQRDFNLSGIEQPERISGSAVSSDFFSMLGVRPVLGRDFLPSEDNAGTEPVVMLTHGLWQRRFGSDPDVIGRTLTLDGRRFTVIAVLPPIIKKAVGGEVYTPIGLWAAGMMERGLHSDTTVIARLRNGVSAIAGGAEMSTIADRLSSEYPVTNTGYTVRLDSLRNTLVGDAETPLLLMLGAVGLVLLIACANVANLMMTRSIAREREFALRTALGAGRSRILRQMLTESTLIALIAGCVGLLLGRGCMHWLLKLIPDQVLQGNVVRIDPSVLAFTLGISLLTATICAIAAALQLSPHRLNEAIKEGGRSSSESPARHTLRHSFAAAEIALALVLAISSGLMLRTLRILLEVDPGFNPHGVFLIRVNLPANHYAKHEHVVAFCRQALDRIAAIPGVAVAALGTTLPLTFDHTRSDISIEGRPLPAFGQLPHPDFHRISGDYFKVLGLPLLRGRTFTDADNESAPEVALVSESLARRYWPDEEPVGKRFSLGRPEPETKWVTVIGVVGDTKQYGLDAQSRMEVYLSYLQHPARSPAFLVRSALRPASLTGSMRNAIQAIDSDLPAHNEMTMDEAVIASLGTRRLIVVLLGGFAALALTLAAIGIYGVVSYTVSTRTHEIGVRMALGASRGKVLGMALGQGLRLAFVGVSIGIAASVALTHLLTGLLFGVRAIDPMTFIVVSALFAFVALAACYIPARRATRIDPQAALRHE